MSYLTGIYVVDLPENFMNRDMWNQVEFKKGYFTLI